MSTIKELYEKHRKAHEHNCSQYECCSSVTDEIFESAMLPEQHCSKSPTGKHEPDADSVTPADGASFTIDYLCVHCEMYGSVKVDPDEIMWE